MSAPDQSPGRVGLVLLCLYACSACADAEVQVEADANVVRVSAQIATRVDRVTAWQVLTDYDHWSEFVPDLLVSRVVSRPGEPLVVEQRGRIPALPNFPLVVVSAVEETPYKSLRFQRIAGNIKAMDGEWRIQGKFRVRVLYQSRVEPGFPLPPQMSIEIFRQDAKLRLEALAQEMARRAATSR